MARPQPLPGTVRTSRLTCVTAIHGIRSASVDDDRTRAQSPTHLGRCGRRVACTPPSRSPRPRAAPGASEEEGGQRPITPRTFPPGTFHCGSGSGARVKSAQSAPDASVPREHGGSRLPYRRLCGSIEIAIISDAYGSPRVGLETTGGGDAWVPEPLECPMRGS
ncbi:hypothetical protein K466DRAFT_146462 [Polyporus arcularius HHB13444]|uniref:Uncharacterized protein n=1 Tax=Polyporus arcularius HHB13444 TaxID=1314778 RepID=A0A5C3PUV5_9APHY|nr:hypothetical protein K466DRAFT_146462 [Polyporus arcularius HHB13444]